MRLLDLFSGAGGAAMGYHQAGITEILGVDIEPQPNYPFDFVQADAMEFLAAMLEGDEDTGFDLIHASPPCQAYSRMTPGRGLVDYPDLVAPVREYLDLIGRPYVIENVVGSPLRAQIRLCGSMFGLDVQRHRYFEYGGGVGLILTPPCDHKSWTRGRPVCVVGHFGAGRYRYKSHLEPNGLSDAREVMGIDWMTRDEITQAIPPAYTKYIGEAILEGIMAA